MKNYTTADDWATITGNLLCKVATTSDGFTGPTPNGNNMQLTWDGATGTATADGAGAPDENYHGLLVDEADTTVIVATNETTNNPVTSGNQVIFGTFTIMVLQPVQALQRYQGTARAQVEEMGIRVEP